MDWFVKVKYKKYREGYVISIGLDPEKHYNTEEAIPIAIFHNRDVADPVLYPILGEDIEAIKGADNAIYVKVNELEEMLEKVKSFYKKFAELSGENIHIEIIDLDAITE